MQRFILSYLILGILLCLFGPLSRRIKETINKHTLPSPSDIFLGKPSVPLKNKIMINLLLFTVSSVFYPFLYAVILLDFFREKLNKNIQHKHPQNNLLYFNYIPGAGKLTCNKCHFHSEIIGFLHGEDEIGIKTTGFQCQNCGMFKSITDNIVNPKNTICNCGGTFKRDNPIFCPKCKSENITYIMKIIT